eukprot:m.234910 g.234910  ORF g.234910 m.234910 type:complete len:4574 (+) comp17091_c0_seq1:164-13885(+)
MSVASSDADHALLLSVEQLIAQTVALQTPATQQTAEAALSGNAAILDKFCTDSQVYALTVAAYQVVEEAGEEHEEVTAQEWGVSVALGIECLPRSKPVVFLKEISTLTAGKPVSDQLRIITPLSGPGTQPFASLHALVQHVLGPLLSGILEAEQAQEQSGVRGLKKSVKDLELSLLQLQQDVHIPRVVLTPHPIVREVIERAERENRKPSIHDFEDKLEDPKFLDALSKTLTRWTREIQQVTKLDRDPATGSAMQEVSFWRNLGTALQTLKKQRESPSVTLTIAILQHGRRFHATMSFDQDSGLDAKIKLVNDYNELMQGFPAKELLAASDTEQLRQALVTIFSHLKRIRKTKYPVKRCQNLILAISRDLAVQLNNILASLELMKMSYADFDRTIHGCSRLFKTWEEEVERFRTQLRMQLRQNPDPNMRTLKILHPEHRPLQDRIEELRRFRASHEQLRNVIERVLKAPTPGEPTSGSLDTQDVQAVADVDAAYHLMKDIDALDLTEQGARLWSNRLQAYMDRIALVEARVSSKLRDQLGAARSANDMFRILGRFEALVNRKNIKNEIKSHSGQLLTRVLTDIEKLHLKFATEFEETTNSRLSKARDVPPVSAKIIWIRQFEHKLDLYLYRVESVLGIGWEKLPEGKKLKRSCDELRAKLDHDAVFNHWQEQASKLEHVSQNNKALGIIANDKGQLELVVDVPHVAIEANNETRNLKFLGHRPRVQLTRKFMFIRQSYSFCMSMEGSVRTYKRTLEKLAGQPNLKALVAKYHERIHRLINDHIDLTWSDHRGERFVSDLAEQTHIFQEKVDSVISADRQIQNHIAELDKCSLTRQALGQVLDAVQAVVDDLDRQAFSQLNKWVKDVDERIGDKLQNRLREAIDQWTKALREYDLVLPPGAAMDQIKEHRKLIKRITLEILIHNQILVVHPPAEAAREALLRQFQQHLVVITSLPRVKTSSSDLLVEDVTRSTSTYCGLLARMSDGSQHLMGAYTAIEKRVAAVDEYVKVWIQYQALWDMQTDSIVTALGDDLQMWNQLLVDIKKARRTFDTAETSKYFGPVEVDYAQVQARVIMKYDALHREMLNKFGTKMADKMRRFFENVIESRQGLEKVTVEGVSTSEAVACIKTLGEMKRRRKLWLQEIEQFTTGQKILERQRYQFPRDWLYIDNIEGEWEAFNEILNKKDGVVQGQLVPLQMKVVSEDRAMDTRITSLLEDWEKSKPVGGTVRPDAAVNILTIYESRFEKLKAEFDALTEAKLALDLPVSRDDRLAQRISELRELQCSWSDLSQIWERINDMKQIPWSAVVPRKLRSSLDDLVKDLKNLPARVREYQSYEYTMNTVKTYVKANKHIVDLKSDALKDRHWRKLTQLLRVDWVLADMMLGDVWEVDLDRHAKAVAEVMGQAQGEMGLEEYLRQVKELWAGFELDLVDYQHKTYLIRGWDDLFNQLKEHITSLEAMRMSPYFAAFEEEATSWYDKLNKMFTTYDVWMDVQRQWVYLEGIFTGSADIKHLLPNETSRFQTISAEFLGLMKRIQQTRMAIDVLAIPDGQKSLERLADLLGKIQKALGEYLERERQAFPRFYFVGDEDLLEIIGNSKNVDRMQKHFIKMFAGVHRILLNDDATQIVGISAKEGEEVGFVQPVTCKDVKINVWLTQVQEQMRLSLAVSLNQAVVALRTLNEDKFNLATYKQWLNAFQAQIVVLAAQIHWSESVERALQEGGGARLQDVVDQVNEVLSALADTVLQYQPPVLRRKLEHMITEMVHQRDVTRELLTKSVTSVHDFEWLKYMRFYFNPKTENVLEQLTICMANTKTFYGFEYLGLVDKLVQTPLTDRCFLTMMQALDMKQGGSPFGPAGTGKTESVKALGAQLGRFVLVFNCDETFDFHAMGRIFVGLCQVGAWGCFDEFNRLEERMLSAVSQQIQTIQLALKDAAPGAMASADLLGRTVPVSPDMAIFITMNPGYAGRSNLPDNLKKLFRPLAMTKPDRQLIAQVMLFSQGFRTAEQLSKKIVPLFILCAEQLSAQSHYDFGLRSLKAVLVSAGNVKRQRLEELRKLSAAPDQEDLAAQIDEQEVLIQSVTQTMVPKLVADDLPLLDSLLSDVFPGVQPPELPLDELKQAIQEVCAEKHYVLSDMFMMKILQVYQVSCLQHGLMLVGPSGSGKTAAWKILKEALQRLEKKEAFSHVIDPKAISKDDLYGTLDATTREWTDGIFTHVIRKIYDNQRNEQDHRQWVVLDGDVDPEWVENLNSVLDDNKLLTLPNGERLSLPSCLRIMFEVQDLRHATLATVSRCGMVWFSEDVVTVDMYFVRYLGNLRAKPLSSDGGSDAASPKALLEIQQQVANVLDAFLDADGLVIKAIDQARDLFHVMEFSSMRCVNSFLAMLNNIPRAIAAYNDLHADFPMTQQQVFSYTQKRLIFALLWALVGDSRGTIRSEFSEWIRSQASSSMDLPQGDIMDYEVQLPTGTWQPWKDKVPRIEIDNKKMAGTDVVVPTLDTVRHEDVLYTWLKEHLPIVLCGPPGSGKTMTLFSALRALPHFEVAGLNFSSSTSPELILKTFDQYCEYRNTPNGIVLAPTQMNKWLVVFMDECNLPAPDAYETVRVVTFLRQMIEQGGFWRTEDFRWVRLERIQFVGACNPPTDPGRVPIDQRLLCHMPVVYVDYPGPESLKMIYGTFNRAILSLQPSVKMYADALTNAMVDFFTQTSKRFTADMQPHYIYSPREMTRWVKGVAEAIEPLPSLDLEGLIRLWAHEALRLFQDRLVGDDEREWTEVNIDSVARAHFPDCDLVTALQRPILYSNWLSKDYVPVQQEELREFVQARLKVFYEEELDVQLVLFDEVLDHVLRIDRVFRQNQGHMLLIGMPGAGKTTLARFVAWMNGLSIFQVKVHNNYNADAFDEDLRHVLRRAGTQGEKIVFIMDEGNVMDTAFLERMNTLLANGEVPGLFEGDEYSTLMNQCKEGAQRNGLVLEGNDELYRWFSHQVMNNLHVVFTMNPSEGGLQERASTSPALFNRCVLNWFGDWPDTAVYQVGYELTLQVDLEKPGYMAPGTLPITVEGLPLPIDHRSAIINACVYVHKSTRQAARRLLKREGRSTVVTPRHFLEFVQQIVSIYTEKRSNLEEQQLHLNVGLDKIEQTFQAVEVEQRKMAEEELKLREMNMRANEKMKEVMLNREKTQRKQQESSQLETVLVQKQAEVKQNKAVVETELAEVEPTLRDAETAVKNIERRHLQELKALGNPPPAVKLALESVLCMLGESNTEWKYIRSYITRDDFISSIINFNPDSVTPKIRDQMTKKYLENPDYDVDKAFRASQAAGPLVKWARAMVNYATMLLKIEPLRNQLKSLTQEAEDMARQHAEVQELLKELEATLAALTSEYNALQKDIGKTEEQLQITKSKVERSMKLLESLNDERERWSKGSEDFANQMATIVGDSLLAGAFLAYAGYFDQTYRSSLFKLWRRCLDDSGVAFKHELAIPEYLSTPDERLGWKSNGLPDDELCTENAIMLKRYIRYPLVIDPAGQAVDFIMHQYADVKIQKTSFLDKSFKKTLESALRFGTPLLVQDAESYDPLLNPVLNHEVRKTGGRVLITLGQDDGIDLSPAFKIILTTRNATHQFPADLCSRVTMVNFTVTRGSLQSQCLNQALRSERPDVDAKRAEQLKLQGAFRAQLRRLERDLLSTLNEVGGSILDDDKVLSALETLKKQAGEVAQKVAESDSVMQEITSVMAEYQPLAQKCSNIFFTLEQLHVVHFLYRYSLQFFLNIFHVVLNENPNLTGVSTPLERLQVIVKDLFKTVYMRVATGLLHEHRMSFAMTLFRFYLQGTREQLDEAEFAHLFSSAGAQVAGVRTSFDFLLSEQIQTPQVLAAEHLTKNVPAFAGLLSDIKENQAEFVHWINSPYPELHLPQNLSYTENVGPVVQLFRHLLLLRALRPDRALGMCHELVVNVFGPTFASSAAEAAELLVTSVMKEVDCRTPLLLCGVRGFDASSKVRDLALAQGRTLAEVAIGSEEGFKDADRELAAAAKTGGWVVLKNVHLGPSWLTTLEKKLLGYNPHASFRLFLTTEINPKLPTSLLSIAQVFVYEPASGLKASLVRALHTIPEHVMAREPAERGRVHLLLCWLHAVIVERLRYAPLGWSKRYEFGEADFKTAYDTIDMWLDLTAQGRSHVDPAKIPWDALQELITSSIYGGRIDNDTDMRLLRAFVDRFFTAASFEEGFPLVEADEAAETAAIYAPEGTRRDQFLQWADSLPNSQSPAWLGLPANAENVLLTNRAETMMNNMHKLQTTDEEDEFAEEGEQAKTSSAVPTWMRHLKTSCQEWLQALPDKLDLLQRSPEKIKDPLFRFFDREVGIGSKLLKTVRRDLNDVILACDGEIKQTNYLRSLMVDHLTKGQVFKEWLRYKVPKGISVSAWIVDFSERIRQLQSVVRHGNAAQDLRALDVWIGGLFVPEAFITATRQAVAQAHAWPLEKLELSLNMQSSLASCPRLDNQSFKLINMRMDGATGEGDRLTLSQATFTVLPVTILRWVNSELEPLPSSGIRVPVYLNATRAELIFTCTLQTTGLSESTVYGRGVALSCSSLSGIV